MSCVRERFSFGSLVARFLVACAASAELDFTASQFATRKRNQLQYFGH